jgi:hypothetical protein
VDGGGALGWAGLSDSGLGMSDYKLANPLQNFITPIPKMEYVQSIKPAEASARAQDQFPPAYYTLQ